MLELIQELLDPSYRDHKYSVQMLAQVIILGYLRGSFYGFPTGSYKYSTDKARTELIIEDSFKTNEESPRDRPRLRVNRGPFIPLKMGLRNNLLYYQMSTDQSKYSTLFSGNIEVVCEHELKLGSEHLASLVFGMLYYYKQDLLQLGFHDIQNYRIDPPQPSPFKKHDGQVGLWETKVVCQTYIKDGWSIRWKTDQEMEEWATRTGIDRRGDRIPPVTVEQIDIIPDVKTSE